jgi:hypothetical protein
VKITEITKKINSDLPGVVNGITIRSSADSGCKLVSPHPLVRKVPLAKL